MSSKRGSRILASQTFDEEHSWDDAYDYDDYSYSEYDEDVCYGKSGGGGGGGGGRRSGGVNSAKGNANKSVYSSKHIRLQEAARSTFKKKRAKR